MIDAVDVVPPPQTPRVIGPGRRLFALVISALIGVPLVLVLVAIGVIVALAWSGTSIDASRWRDAAAQRASAALGRPVILQGALEIEPRLGREFGLRVGPLRILSPTGFSEPEFLTIGELRARVDLFEALRGRLRSSSIEARGVGLWLERGADGVGNWMSSPQPDSRSRPPGIEIARIVLHGLDIHYLDARAATRRVVELDEVSGSADAALRLVARGRLEPGLAYSLRVDGGPLRPLADDADAWPFTLDLDTDGARLRARGALDTRQRTAQFEVDARAEDLAPIERLLGTPLPHFADASVQCTVRVAPDSVDVIDLHGALGESRFSGQLTLAFGGVRPRISGALSAAALDLGPLLVAQPQGQRSGDGAPAGPSLLLRDLAAFDADLDLKVERWLGLGVDIRESRFAWRADRQGVRVPMSATIEGVPFAGNLELDTLAATPTLAFQLGADNAVLGDRVLGPGPAGGVEGTVGRLRLRMDGRGETPAALARDLEFSLALAAARLRLGGRAGAGPVDVSIDTLDLAARRGGRLRGHAHGALLGEPATLRLRGGTVPDMLRERVLPFELNLALAHARLQVDGKMGFAKSSPLDTSMRFDFHAPRAGDLSRWLGVAPQASLPLALRGTVRLADAAWSLDPTTLELGRSQLTIDAHSTRVAGRSGIAATVRSALIDAQELSTLRDRSARSRAGPGSNAPAIFAALAMADADVEFQLQRLRLGRTDLEDLAFVARTRDGNLLPMSVTGQLAGAPITANVAMDLKARPPAATLDLSTGAIDIGALLRGLGVAEDIDGHAQAVQVHVLARGSDMSEWVRHSAIDMRVHGGHLVVRGAAQSTVAEMRLDEARIGAMAGEPLRARLDGAIGQTPLRIDLKSGTLAELTGDPRHVPFSLAALAAGAQLTLEGEVSLPLGTGAQLRLEMRGERLDSLSDLARVELPAWSPWSISSPISITPAGYELQSLHVGVGHSQLSGTAKLDLSRARPYLDLQLAAPSIQLDDFPLPDRLTESPDDGRGPRQAASRLAGRTDKLLSAAFLRRLDATIDLTAKEVLSGSDRLADGALRLKLEDGRLYLDPAVVNLPGGAVRLSISYDLKQGGVELAVAAYVERFDYGIIARRMDRTADLHGLFSFNLELTGTAPSLDTIMRTASGRLDFAIWPTELHSGSFNLWSANLLQQLVPLLDPNPRPKVNCIVGRFDLQHGDLSDDKILIDTSAVRIRGAGHANLATEELEFVFRPRAKGLALFRLQTPLRVSGRLGDQRFGFSRFDVAESVLRLIASPILLPIERLTLGPLPRDGADVCTDPLRARAP